VYPFISIISKRKKNSLMLSEEDFVLSAITKVFCSLTKDQADVLAPNCSRLNAQSVATPTALL
jgi:hypothetical protein